jgi:hypothetical protein
MHADRREALDSLKSRRAVNPGVALRSESRPS